MFTGVWFLIWLFSSSPSFNFSDPGSWGMWLIIALIADFFLALSSD